MTIRHCLRCRRLSLVHTGGFWACGHCGFAITQTALSVEHRERLANERHFTTDGLSEAIPGR
jgi:hypothetical protein